MSRDLVTIGGQTFVYDEQSGWIDKKTKKPADENLIKLLSTVSPSRAHNKSLPKPKLSIDKSVEPIFIGDQKYVFDKNLNWIDEKTKKPASENLKKIFSQQVDTRDKEVDKTEDKEKVNKEIKITISENLGMIGKAVADDTIEDADITSDAIPTKHNNSFKELNLSLNIIDKHFKKQLDDQKDYISLTNIEEKEMEIEAKQVDAELIKEEEEDEKRSNSFLLLIPVIVGAWLTTKFKPIKDAISVISEKINDVKNSLSLNHNTLVKPQVASTDVSDSSDKPERVMALSEKPDAISTTIPKGNIESLGNYLKDKGFRVSEQSKFGGVHRVHEKDSTHYSDQALDVNIGYGLTEANDVKAGAKFDALAAELKSSGYNVIWRKKGHYNHLHVDTKSSSGVEPIVTRKPDVIKAGKDFIADPSLETGAALADNSYGSMMNMIKAIAHTDTNFRPIGRNTSNDLDQIAMKKYSDLVVARTPKENKPIILSLPNLNNKSGTIQNISTSDDNKIVHQYISYFGLD